MKLVFATRPSTLARRQTGWVMEALQRVHPDLRCEEKIITTEGDLILDKPLPEIGGKGLFTGALEAQLLAGAVDCAVHSLKDLPVEGSAGLEIGCIPVRADVRDVLVSRDSIDFDRLANGASVGTSSLRRAAQLLARRPDLRILPVRGNVDTRIRKVQNGQFDAIVLAGAGLQRLQVEHVASEWLSLDLMLPAPGQGALAVQCRADDAMTLRLLAVLEDASTRAAVTAERAFLKALGGGCSVPVAAHAHVNANGPEPIRMTGLVISEDGRRMVRVSGEGSDPPELGMYLAERAISQGAREILSVPSN